MNRAILLVDIEESGKCRINEEAISMLRGLPSPISVISVAGLYRTGKSFLLNRFLGLQDAFEIGPSVNPCTKGLWIWGEPTILPNGGSSILIDTEGLGSFERDSTTDMHIFTLAVLLSSVFIYNSMGNIDEQALEALSLVCKLTEHIQVKEFGENADQYSLYFPKFIWALRDFTLDIGSFAGAPREYLEDCLRPIHPESSQDLKQKNEIRRGITSYFRDRECYTFIRPVSDERQLRNINTLPYEDLRPQFRTQMESFIKPLFYSPKYKVIDGSQLNGMMFVELLEQYVSAINKNTVPTISTAWERVVDSQLKDFYNGSMNIYKNEFAGKFELPIDMETIRVHDREARIQAVEHLDGFMSNSTTVGKFREIRRSLYGKMDEMYEAVLFENENLSKQICQNAAKAAIRIVEDKIMTSDTFEWYPQGWKDAQAAYNAEAAEPLKAKIGFEYFTHASAELADEIINRQQLRFRKESNDLQGKIGELNGRLEATQSNLHEEVQRSQREIENERSNFRVQKRQLDDAMEDVKQIMESKNEAYGQEKTGLEAKNAGLRQDMKGLKRQLRDFQARPPPAANVENAPELTKAIKTALKQLQEVDHERIAYKIRYEYETRIMNIEKNTQRQINEFRKVSEQTIENVKRSYDSQIKHLEQDKVDMEHNIKEVTREYLEKEAQIRLLQERIRSQETEKRLRVEHADTMCNVSDLVMKLLKRMDAGKGSGDDLARIRDAMKRR